MTAAIVVGPALAIALLAIAAARYQPSNGGRR